METTILQVPIPKSLKSGATSAAKAYGFSSLQEIVRVFLTKIAKRELTVTIQETPIYLSKKAEQRYSKMDKDFAQGRNSHFASNAEELVRQLRS